jgi:mRNA interferase MazF
MKIYNQSEIVLLLFPFSDSSEGKRRPALVLFDTGDDDLIVARITSQMTQTEFDVEILEWQKAGLLVPSVVRVHKLATLEKSLVERKLGALILEDWVEVRKRMLHLWSLI